MHFTNYLTCNGDNKHVLIREDFNVPMVDGKITDASRITAAIPTIASLLKQNAKISIMSHLGRPKAGSFDPKYSLAPVAAQLETMLNFPVKLVKADFKHEASSNYISLIENVRFLEGETENNNELAQKMADCCDVFIMDAFATAHRAHASTSGVAMLSKQAFAGPLLTKEIYSIQTSMDNPKKPIIAIVGGAKISSKLPLLYELVNYVDYLIIAGGMANTCLKANGIEIGNSLFEPDLLAQARELVSSHTEQILLPVDCIVTKKIQPSPICKAVPLSAITPDDIITDIGAKTAQNYTTLINDAKTIIWNGPMGIFEIPEFANGTKIVADAVANSSAYSLAGGGDTISAINTFEIASKISYISTGGGAFLALLQRQKLPGIDNLATDD